MIPRALRDNIEDIDCMVALFVWLILDLYKELATAMMTPFI